jgi:hypothetical protein
VVFRLFVDNIGELRFLSFLESRLEFECSNHIDSKDRSVNIGSDEKKEGDADKCRHRKQIFKIDLKGR